MGGRADIKAGGAFVDLFLKDAKFKAGIAGAKATLRSLGVGVATAGAGLAAAGAAILAPLTAAVAQFTQIGGDLHDMSIRTGVAASKLAMLKYAAEQTGASIEDVEKAIRHAQKHGFSADNFGRMAEEIARIPDPAKRAARAMELFGRGGTRLLPMFAEFAELQAKWDQLGIGPSEASVRLADELGDLWGDLKAVFASVAYELGAALAPALKEVVSYAIPLAKELNRVIRQNPQVVVALAGLAAVAVALGTALVVVGTAIAATAAVVGFLATEAAAIIATITFVTIVVAAATVAFIRWTKAGQMLAAGIGSAFKRLEQIVGKTMKGIGDALKSGDMQLAWEISVTAMTVVWKTFTQRVFTSIAQINAALVKLAGGFLGGNLMLSSELSVTNLANEQARGAGIDAQLAIIKLGRLQKQAAAKAGGAAGSAGGSPSDYALPPASSAVIGFNAFSAIQSRQVIGGGRNVVNDTLTKILAVEQEMLRQQKAGRRNGKQWVWGH